MALRTVIYPADLDGRDIPIISAYYSQGFKMLITKLIQDTTTTPAEILEVDFIKRFLFTESLRKKINEYAIDEALG